jgi:thiol-disulfide isomerase/thioredoxin
MMRSAHARRSFAGLVVAIVLAACGTGAPAPAAPAAGGAAPAPTRSAQAQPTAAAMAKPTAAEMAKPAGDEAMHTGPAWFDIALKDVNSGQTFKLSDFKGQIVLVEGMAAWCTNCLRQQRELVNLHAQIGDAAISIAIDVDLNEDEALLRQHAGRNGFDWRYAIATPELAQALADEFGNRFLNPPSVPMFLIDKEGSVHLLDFGHKTAAYLTGQIQSYQ